jgi:hypothetical protein
MPTTAIINRPSEIQQLVGGFRTVSIYPGRCTVRVHEALDASYRGQASRYFISVELKFREHDALNVGKLGKLGCTKSEANREARELASRIASAWTALEAAREQALRWDTFTNRFTQKLQQEAFDKLVGRYCAGFVG